MTVEQGLSDILRRHTRRHHRQAEQSGIVHEMLQGRVCRAGYTLFMRNLLPVYRQLETELERHRDKLTIDRIAEPAIYRSDAIAADLNALIETGTVEQIPMLAASRRYIDRISTVANTDESGLIAHVYTRYLGDLNGGRILRKLLAGSMGLGAEALSFYEFPGLDIDSFKVHYRERIDRTAPDIRNLAYVIDEAKAAFLLNIDLSEEVARLTPGSRTIEC